MWSCPRFLNIPQGNPPPFPLPPVPPIPGEGYPVRIPGKQTGDRWELLLHVEKHAECRKRNVWTTFWKPGNQQVFILCSTIIELSNHGTRCLSFFSRVLVEYADETPCLVMAGQWWPDVYFCVWRRLLAECRLNDGTQTFGPHCCSTFRTFLVYQRSKIKCNNESFWSKLKTKSSSGYKTWDGLMKQKVQSGHRVPFIPELCKPSEYWDEEGHEETMGWWRQACLRSFMLVEHFMYTLFLILAFEREPRVSVSVHVQIFNFISIIYSARFSKT